MRLADWPRTPYLNEELREWIRQQLEMLAVDEIAIFAVEAGAEGDERRILTATEIGLLDMYYAPAGSSARFRLVTRLYPWQAVRGVDLRGETFRLWALEDRSRWLLRIGRPRFSYTTELPELGRCLAEFAKVAAIMAEPSGWQPPSEEEEEEEPMEAPAARASPVSSPPIDEEPAAREPAEAAPRPSWEHDEAPAQAATPPDEEEIAFVEPSGLQGEQEPSEPARRGFRFPGR
jgi:hypothetical protein